MDSDVTDKESNGNPDQRNDFIHSKYILASDMLPNFVLHNCSLTVLLLSFNFIVLMSPHIFIFMN